MLGRTTLVSTKTFCRCGKEPQASQGLEWLFCGQGQMTRSSEETSNWSLLCIAWCFSCWQFYQLYLIRVLGGASLQPHSVGSIDCGGCLWTAVSRSLPILSHVSRSAAVPPRSDAVTTFMALGGLEQHWEFSHFCWYLKIERTFFSKFLLQIMAFCQLSSVDGWIVWYWKCLVASGLSTGFRCRNKLWKWIGLVSFLMFKTQMTIF